MGKRNPSKMTPFNFVNYIVIAIIASLISVNIIKNLADVEFAVLEATGDINVLLKSDKKPITPHDLLTKHGLKIPTEIFTDCGMLIYKKDQPVMAGGSGCGCSATVTYGHFLNRMRKGELERILVIATGALLSPLSYQQKESIPCIAHAVSIEM